MIPADIDASLSTGEPLLDSLDDGFSPPPQEQPQWDDEAGWATGRAPEAQLLPKSLF
jgi:hypothetical protein